MGGSDEPLIWQASKHYSIHNKACLPFPGSSSFNWAFVCNLYFQITHIGGRSFTISLLPNKCAWTWLKFSSMVRVCQYNRTPLPPPLQKSWLHAPLVSNILVARDIALTDSFRWKRVDNSIRWYASFPSCISNKGVKYKTLGAIVSWCE